MNNNVNKSLAGISDIRARFEKVLIKHLRRLEDSAAYPSRFPLKLDLITCLCLLVEREKEMEDLLESSPERYSRQSFLEDISEIGLGLTETVSDSIQNLVELGCLDIRDDGKFYMREPGFAAVRILDQLFPTMQGLNLLGYLVQGMEEVLSGRKSMDDAIQQLDQTLQTRGVSLSLQQLDKIQHEPQKASFVDKNTNNSGKSDSTKRKQTILEQLSKVKSRISERPSEPAVWTNTGYSKNIKVREIFPKPKSETPMEVVAGVNKSILPPSAKTENAVSEQQDSQTAETAETASVPDAGELAFASEPEDPEVSSKPRPYTENKAAHDDFAPAQRIIEEPKPEDAEKDETHEGIAKVWPVAESQPSLGELEEPAAIAGLPPGPESVAPDLAEGEDVAKPDTRSLSHKESAHTDTDIENRIKNFEVDLSISCPLCNTGKIRLDKTDKGRVYYSCSEESCQFISWGKPYHFKCPLCLNPFLIEYPIDSAKQGLKCPRASCRFRQDNLSHPLVHKQNISSADQAPSMELNGVPKKRLRKVVRRKVVRKSK